MYILGNKIGFLMENAKDGEINQYMRGTRNMEIFYGSDGNLLTINNDKDTTIKFYRFSKDERCYIQISYGEFLRRKDFESEGK